MPERLISNYATITAHNKRWSAAGSCAPQSSRALCIDSCGTPTSTVSTPSRVAAIGPIVEPHGKLLRDTKTCTAISAC